TDIAGLGQRGRIADGKRHVENAGESASEQRLAAAGRADEQNIALIDFDFAMALVAQAQPLVVIVHGDGEDLLGPLLADDVLVELILDVAGRRDVREQGLGDSTAAFLLIDDRLAELDAFAADEYVARSFDQWTDVAIAFAAKGAVR